MAHAVPKLVRWLAYWCASLAATAAALGAQTTWVVDLANGAGSHFRDLPAAVAAASAGDTILVRAADPLFWGRYAPFSTNKGLTIVGERTPSPPTIATGATSVRVDRLPANQSFCMVGFDVYRGDEFSVEVTDCQGPVHLEALRMFEPGLFAPRAPAVTATRTALLTLHGVELFGTPAAVVATNSHVVLSDATLGITSLGLGSGACVQATDSVVEVAWPRFAAINAVAIDITRSRLVLCGDAGSFVQGGFSIPPFTPAILASGGTVVADPAVALNPSTGPLGIAGTATVRAQATPSTVVRGAVRGATATILTAAPAGSVVGVAVGVPAPPFPLNLPGGALVADPTTLTTVALGTVGAGGIYSVALPVPASLPLGSAWIAQAGSVANGQARLGLGCGFALR